MKLDKQIQSKRKNLNLSQEALADKIFVSRQTISNWENGRSYPDIQNLLLLSAIFDVTLDELVKGDIEVMKKKVSSSKMDKYTIIMISFILLSMLSIGPSLYLPSYWAFLPPIVLWLVGMYGAIRVEKMKKTENIRTYKEIINFMENKDSIKDNNQDSKSKDRLLLIITVILFSLIGGGIALGSIWLINIL
ncbi:XRE family transcriptional regulator [Carnobacterium maltaromaticum]|nr:helix-turn-helix transcriptional regulator [Carnobacterium maltaromaticum]KRN83895.1 transcriptional regulator [Carnobacterium maltaromaticum]MBC9809057.1 helix-turn-helix domain-containing protein [Carnobacterium maltaromaticum]MDT1943655.1 helix-turn-helix domain-containing protein [Carnobacterium maltaromaticum]MDT1999035.1 helix-turn-helix domain-containing protein [Carnobacterium maltaromaticum]TFJ24534.1 XRE family transcriptional regulator [Carnobacterium maltaromaticum]